MPVNPQVCNSMVLPNLSGVKHEIEAGTSNILGTTFSNFVPYTGATANVDLSTFGIRAGGLNTNANPNTPSEGSLITPTTIQAGGTVARGTFTGGTLNLLEGVGSHNDAGFTMGTNYLSYKDYTETTDSLIYIDPLDSNRVYLGSTIFTSIDAYSNFETKGRLRATGGVSETATGTARFDIGVQNGTPRMVLEQAGYTPWQVDTFNGVFRWFQPSIVFFYIQPNATPTNGAYSQFGGTYNVSFDTASGASTFGRDVQVVRNLNINGKTQIGYSGTTEQRSYAILDLNTSSSKGLSLMDSVNGGLLIGYTGSNIQARTTANGNTQKLILQPFGGDLDLSVNGSSTITTIFNQANFAGTTHYSHINYKADSSEDTYLRGGKSTSDVVIGDTITTGYIKLGGGGANVGIAVNNPTAKLEVLSTGEQLRLEYDTSNYFSTTVGSTGGVTLNAVGSGAGFTFSDAITVPVYERHIQIPASVNGTPANSPTAVDFFTAGGLQFATTGTKYAFCQWEIPNDWDGTDIYIEVDWFPDSGATSGTDTVKWDVEYRAIAEGETINNGTSVTVSSTDSGDYSQYQTKHARHTLTYNNANQPLAKQDHVYFKISRDTGVSNDFGGSVTVPAFEIIYNSTKVPTGG
jgi:hypothetical protein